MASGSAAIPFLNCREKLPKAEGGSEPLPEGLFYLMLVGELPTDEDAQHVSNVWQRRSHVPDHVFNTIECIAFNRASYDAICCSHNGLTNRKPVCKKICSRHE